MATTSSPAFPRARLMRKFKDGRVLAALTVLLLAVVVIILIAGGAGGSAAERPPATGAAALVPADALAYVHVSIDSSRQPVKQALALAQTFPDFPLLEPALSTRLSTLAPVAGAVDFGSDIRPWLGKEVALALLNTPGSTAGSLIVLDVSDPARARSFLARFGSGSPLSYRATPITSYARGTEVAFVRHYMVIGQDSSVRAAIDTGSGNAQALSSNSTYQRASAGQPAGRVVDAYASTDGVRRLLAPQGGIIGALGALLYQPALDGVSIALTPRPGGAAIRVHSALDPHLAQLNRAAGGASQPFSPSLPSSIPAGTTLLLDLTKLDQMAPRILGAGTASGIGGGVGALLRRLGGALQAEGVNVQRDILSLFHGETAVAIAPADGGALASGTPVRPALVIVAPAANENRTRTALAALEVPLAQLFPPPGNGPGRTPLFNDRQVAGITAHQLILSAGLELDYAVFDHKLVISTSLQGIGAVRRHTRALTEEPGYRTTLGNRPAQLTSLLFLDFSQLLSLGEQTGLTRSTRYSALRPDLQKVRAIGLSSTGGETDSTAELFLQIS